LYPSQAPTSFSSLAIVARNLCGVGALDRYEDVQGTAEELDLAAGLADVRIGETEIAQRSALAGPVFAVVPTRVLR